MIQYIVANPATVAAFLSFFATIFAAWATWKGPQTAALLAETIRARSEIENEQRRMKLNIFSTLMQERATIASLDAVRMLNSIDFVFAESANVREAWAELFDVFKQMEPSNSRTREEKIRNLLKEMAKELGLSETLKFDDLGRIYYPNALAREEELKLLQQEAALRQMRTFGTDPTVSMQLEKFPPPPK